MFFDRKNPKNLRQACAVSVILFASSGAGEFFNVPILVEYSPVIAIAGSLLISLVARMAGHGDKI